MFNSYALCCASLHAAFWPVDAARCSVRVGTSGRALKRLEYEAKMRFLSTSRSLWLSVLRLPHTHTHRYIYIYMVEGVCKLFHPHRFIGYFLRWCFSVSLPFVLASSSSDPWILCMAWRCVAANPVADFSCCVSRCYAFKSLSRMCLCVCESLCLK